jgi:hypothetical protein
LQDDLDLGWYSFKWRNHDPAIGRFFNIDPLAEKYVYNSPYAFSENHVTSHIELEGLEKVSINGGVYAAMKAGVNKAAKTAQRYDGLKRTHYNVFRKPPSNTDKAQYLFSAAFTEYGGYSDAEDISVLTKGKTIEGNNANAVDYGFAVFGLALPFISGGAAKKLAKPLISTEPGMQSTKKVTDMAEQISNVKSTEEFAELFKNADTNIEVIEHNGKYYIHNGHHRVEAAIEAGVEFEIPVEVITIEHSRFDTVEEMLEAAQNEL